MWRGAPGALWGVAGEGKRRGSILRGTCTERGQDASSHPSGHMQGGLALPEQCVCTVWAGEGGGEGNGGGGACGWSGFKGWGE